MEIKKAREILGKDRIIGATAHNVAEAVAVYEAGADYIGAGACFTSTTKSDTIPLSYDELKSICSAVPIPVVAIGGINEGNVSRLNGSGIAGAAVVSAIFGAADAELAAAHLRHKLEILVAKPDSVCEHIKKVYLADTVNLNEDLRMGIKAAIFDMDGTILDSMPMWEHLASDYVKSLGAVPDDDLDIRIKTMTIYEAADYVRERYRLKKSNEDIVDDINSMVSEEYGQRLKLKPGVYEFLKSLKKRGIKLALATATEYNLAISAMSRLGLYVNNTDSILDEICTCSMAGQGKNKPDVYFMACKKLGVKKEDVIIYEDSLFAMQTAKMAGFKVAAVFDKAERENWCEICELADYKIMSGEWLSQALLAI
jgi:beta-phosphoglucomutase-like phosphatase (HAD superfamily)